MIIKTLKALALLAGTLGTFWLTQIVIFII